jgi:hypothetical protein
MGKRYHRPADWLPHVGGVGDELSDIAEAMSE